MSHPLLGILNLLYQLRFVTRLRIFTGRAGRGGELSEEIRPVRRSAKLRGRVLASKSPKSGSRLVLRIFVQKPPTTRMSQPAFAKLDPRLSDPQHIRDVHLDDRVCYGMMAPMEIIAYSPLNKSNRIISGVHNDGIDSTVRALIYSHRLDYSRMTSDICHWLSAMTPILWPSTISPSMGLEARLLVGPLRACKCGNSVSSCHSSSASLDAFTLGLSLSSILLCMPKNFCSLNNAQRPNVAMVRQIASNANDHICL